MREILFKAKNIATGEWVEGSLIQTTAVSLKSFIVESSCYTFDKWDWNECVQVDTNTICQYTGLTDKNGNKIWENDVVKKHFYTDYDAYANSEEYVGIVKFTDCAWVIDTKRNEYVCTRPIFESMAYSKDVDYFEVIGNIFDNPELLKGSEEE